MSFIEVHIHRNVAALTMELYLRAGKGTFCTIDDGVPTVHQVNDAGLNIEPALRLPDEVGGKLLDALLQAGYRPTKTLPPAETIAALQGHVSFAERMADRLLMLLGGRNDRHQERAGRVGAGDRATPEEHE